MRTTNGIGRLAAAMICAVFVPGCAGEMSYKRVDELPTGSQIDALASSFHAVVRTPHVRYLYPASYEDVWNAAKEVMPTLKETGKEPVLTFDEDQGVIVLGLDHRDDTAKTMDNPNPIRIRGWREEIRVELMQQPRDTTLVIVSRIVLGVPFQRRCHKYEDPCANPIVFEPEVSNGEMERYVLGLIRQAVAKQIVAKVTHTAPPATNPRVETTVSAPPLDAPPAPVNLIAPASSRPQASPPITIPAPESEAVVPTPKADGPAATSSVPSPSSVQEGATPTPQPNDPAQATSPALPGDIQPESGTIAPSNTAPTAPSPASTPNAPPDTTSPGPHASAPAEPADTAPHSSTTPAAPTTNASEGSVPAAPPEVPAASPSPAEATSVSQ